MTRPSIAFGILAALLVAGCTTGPSGSESGDNERPSPSGSANPEDPLPRNRTESPRRDWSLLGCRSLFITFAADALAVQARLPPGYDVVAAGPVTPASLKVIHCEGIVLDNKTVINDAWFAQLDVSVTPPHALDTAVSDAYVLEWLAANQTLSDRARELGLPAQDVVIQELPADIGFALEITTPDGSAIYSITGSSDDEGSPPEFTNVARFHHVDAATVTIDVTSTGEQSADIIVSVVEASRGVAPEIAVTGETGAFAGPSVFWDSERSMRFEEHGQET